MKAFAIDKYGSDDNVRAVQVPDPRLRTPGPLVSRLEAPDSGADTDYDSGQIVPQDQGQAIPQDRCEPDRLDRDLVLLD
jgi:hypothetical protein